MIAVVGDEVVGEPQVVAVSADAIKAMSFAEVRLPTFPSAKSFARSHHSLSEAYDAELLCATVGSARKTTWKCRGPSSPDAELKQARTQHLRLGEGVSIKAAVNQLKAPPSQSPSIRGRLHACGPELVFSLLITLKLPEGRGAALGYGPRVDLRRRPAMISPLGILGAEDLAQPPYSPLFGQGVCDLRQACGVGDIRKTVSLLDEADTGFAGLAGDVLMAVQDHLRGEGRMSADLDGEMAPVRIEDMERE